MNTFRNKSKIFGFGTAAIDFRITTAEMGSGYKEKLLAQKTEVFGGGATANCLVQVVRLGGNAYWLGKLGDDWIAKKILEQLEREGIRCSGAIQDPDSCSPFNVAIYAGENKRRIGGFLLPNSLSNLKKEDIEVFCSQIEEGNWIIVEIGEVPLDWTLEFCMAAKACSAKIMIDVDLDPIRQCLGSNEIIQRIFNCAEILVPNRSTVEPMYPDLPPGKLVEKMAREYGTIVVVTAGEDGAYYSRQGSSFVHKQAVQVEVVDSVGAGDAFHGGLLFALSEGLSLEDAVELGVRCGTENCKAFGARTGMSTRSDMGLEKLVRDAEKY